MLTSTVYTVASSDSCGLNTQIFITLRQPIPGLPRTPKVRVTTSGPSCCNSSTNPISLRFGSCWKKARTITGMPFQSHTLELQPNFSVI